MVLLPSGNRNDIQPFDDPVCFRKISCQMTDRQRQFAHKRWDRENLILRGQMRVGGQINDLQPMTIREMLLTQPCDISHRSQRLPSLAHDIEPQIPGCTIFCRGWIHTSVPPAPVMVFESVFNALFMSPMLFVSVVEYGFDLAAA